MKNQTKHFCFTQTFVTILETLKIMTCVKTAVTESSVRNVDMGTNHLITLILLSEICEPVLFTKILMFEKNVFTLVDLPFAPYFFQRNP